MALHTATIVVLVTAPKGKGEEIARKLLEERLVACVNIANARSLYWWKGRIESDEEDLLVIKTTVTMLPQLARKLKEIHPYEVPELLAIPVLTGLKDYIEWVEEEVGQGKAESK